jgi:hypothetical protein
MTPAGLTSLGTETCEHNSTGVYGLAEPLSSCQEDVTRGFHGGDYEDGRLLGCSAV